MVIEIPVKLNTVRSHRIIQLFLERSKNWCKKNRDFSIYWNTSHMTTTSQIMRLLAVMRGLNPDICAIAGALHDIATMESGKHENHMLKSLDYIEPLLKEYNVSSHCQDGKYSISNAEIELLKEIIPQHGDKDKISDNPYVEALRDADAIDRYLQGVETKEIEMPRLTTLLSKFNVDVNFV